VYGCAGLTDIGRLPLDDTTQAIDQLHEDEALRLVIVFDSDTTTTWKQLRRHTA
jgi:hypothetical protein